MLASTAPQIYAMAAVLVAVAIGLILYGVRLVRITRHDPAALAPLEVMEARSWRRASRAEQQAALDAARPPGAAPIPVADVPTVEDVPDVEHVEVVEVAEVPGVVEDITVVEVPGVVEDILVVEVLDSGAES